MRISDRSSDVCSSDLEFEGTETSAGGGDPGGVVLGVVHVDAPEGQVDEQVVEDLLHLPAVAELDLVAVAVAPEDDVRLADLEARGPGAAHPVGGDDEQVGLVGERKTVVEGKSVELAV